MGRGRIYTLTVAIALISLVMLSKAVAEAAQRGQIGGPPSIALGPPDEGKRTTPDLVIGRATTPFGTTELVAYGWLAPPDSLPSGPRRQFCIWAEHLPKEISWGMCGRPLDPEGNQKIVIDSRGGTLGKPAQRFAEIGGRLTPNVASVRIFYRRNGRKESSLATVAQVAGELQRKLHQAVPFGYFNARVRGRVPWRSIRVEAYDSSGAVLDTAGHGSPSRRGDFGIDESRTSEVHLRGTKGYAVSLFASRSSSVYLTVTGHNATVQYITRGRVTRHLIKARFGRFGRVSVRFRPSQKPHRVPQPRGNCEGRGELVEPGEFVGTIKFVGEQSYTEVHANRAEGKISYKTKEVCHETGGRSPSRSVGFLILSATERSGGASFTALKPLSKAFPDESSFMASIAQFQRKLLIVHSILSQSSGDAFKTVMSHGKLIQAMVEPPAPFSGSATYSKTPAVSSEGWTGDLAGDFPGIGKVSLAGSAFCAGGVLLTSCESSGRVAAVIAARR